MNGTYSRDRLVGLIKLAGQPKEDSITKSLISLFSVNAG